jgi:hypothetical protein
MGDFLAKFLIHEYNTLNEKGFFCVAFPFVGNSGDGIFKGYT